MNIKAERRINNSFSVETVTILQFFIENGNLVAVCQRNNGRIITVNTYELTIIKGS